VTVATDKIESLRAAATSVVVDPAACAPFAVDGVTPAAVVEPEDAGELCEIVRWARAHKAALVPVTSGCYLPVGNPPAAADVAVSLARLNRVLAYDPGDLTLTVEAGAPIAALEATLREHGQFLPALTAYFERAAVGGLVAVNASSPLRFGYGSWRDFIVGMKFVAGDAKLVKTGGRVVKNVAGYDLSKLLIGSLGSLGVITEVSFKVFPQAEKSGTFVAGFSTLGAALKLRDLIVHSVLQPTAIELISAAAARLIGSPLLPTADWTLLVSAGGAEAVIARYQRELEARAREAGVTSFAAHARENQSALWAGVRELIATAREKNPAAAIVKTTLPLTNIGPFLLKAQQVAARYELPAAAHAHAGSGIAYIYLLPQQGTADAHRKTAQAATEMIHAGNNLGGRTTVPWCPTGVKRDVNVWGPLRDDFPLMQKLKAQFDPDRILNPGRFVGGL
jgi:glycolate oxidase FAD binding subunit